MSSLIGKQLKLSIFGESHGKTIGCVLDGLPAGEELDLSALEAQMLRRAPGRDQTATKRKESDLPLIVSGLLNNRTTGAPLTMLIHNENQHSGDYDAVTQMPRPGHADYTGFLRYDGYNDVRGGGHFSGRLTAPLVFAGAVCRQILMRQGVTIGGHILRIADQCDTAFSPLDISPEALQYLSASSFALINGETEQSMRQAVEAARLNGDSIGGVVEVAAVGFPAGIGSPMFDGIENRLAAIFFGIPAVKGVEFGDGFDITKLRGSEANDAMTYLEDGSLSVLSNHNGGILGGISNGAPLIARLAIKPTPSISQPQPTVNLQTNENQTLHLKGRHDPCIVPRAVSVAESAMAFGLLDMLMSEMCYPNLKGGKPYEFE